MKPTAKSPERGFTLIEVLAVVLVGGIMLAALTSFYLSEQRAFRRHQIEVETSQMLRIALDQIVRDLRAAGRNPAEIANVGLSYADGSEVRFNLDYDGGGTIDANDANENKGFRRNGTTLELYLGGVTQWQELATDLDTATTMFQYFDESGATLTGSPTDTTFLNAIRRIDVTVKIVRTTGGISITRREAATVQLRNLS